MKKLIAVFFVFASLSAIAQINKNVQILENGNNYYDKYIPTSIFDTIGVSLTDVGWYITIHNVEWNYEGWMSIYPVYPSGLFRHYYVDSIVNGITYYSIDNYVESTGIPLPKGYAQYMHTDTLLGISGVALAIDLPNNDTLINNVKDTISILDGTTLEPIYSKALNDTLRYPYYYYHTGWRQTMFYEIYFDSTVNVQGDYYIAYKIHKDNIDSTGMQPYKTPLYAYYWFSYNNMSDLLCTYKNYNKQIKIYSDELGWKDFKDFKDAYNLPKYWLSSMVEESPFTNLDDRTRPFHTTDLAVFVIPESAFIVPDTVTTDTIQDYYTPLPYYSTFDSLDEWEIPALDILQAYENVNKIYIGVPAGYEEPMIFVSNNGIDLTFDGTSYSYYHIHKRLHFDDCDSLRISFDANVDGKAFYTMDNGVDTMIRNANFVMLLHNRYNVFVKTIEVAIYDTDGLKHFDTIIDNPLRDEDGILFISWYNGLIGLENEFSGYIKNIKIEDANAVSLNDVKENRLFLYPNPAEDYVVVETEEDIVIYNYLGQKIKEFTNLHGQTTIDISSLNKGVYVVKSGSKIEKLIKK